MIELITLFGINDSDPGQHHHLSQSFYVGADGQDGRGFFIIRQSVLNRLVKMMNKSTKSIWLVLFVFFCPQLSICRPTDGPDNCWCHAGPSCRINKIHQDGRHVAVDLFRPTSILKGLMKLMPGRSSSKQQLLFISSSFDPYRYSNNILGRNKLKQSIWRPTINWQVKVV